MSTGERSCVNYGSCNLNTAGQCSISCSNYEWDKEREPDTHLGKQFPDLFKHDKVRTGRIKFKNRGW